MSPKRVKIIQWDDNDLTVHLKGAARERVQFMYTLDSVLGHFDCMMSESGTARISFYRQECIAV